MAAGREGVSIAAYRPRLVVGVGYRFELCRESELIATGHLQREQPLEIGEWIEIGGQRGIVREIEPISGERELRLIVQLARP